MEKLNDCKFQQLTTDEMKLLEGGWGWRVIEIHYDKLAGADNGSTIVEFQYYNIWGNPTDRYDHKLD